MAELPVMTDSLYAAARRGDLAGARAIISVNPGSVHDRDPDYGTSALHWAVKGGHIELATLLLDAGADVDARDNSGRTPLQWLIPRDSDGSDERRPMLQLLLARGAQHTLEMAIRRGTAADVRRWLERGTSLDTPLPDGGSMLAYAAQHADPEVVRTLIDAGALPDGELFDAETPLLRAVRAQRLEAALMILQAGADPERSNGKHTPLDEVVDRFEYRRGDAAELGALLLQHGAQMTPQWAAAHDDPELLARSLAAGSDVNRRGAYGRTALFVAAARQHIRIIQALLAAGGDPNIGDEYGDTPLHLVARAPFMTSPAARTAIAKLLLAAGANPNGRGMYGGTPLHAALDGLHTMGVNLEVVQMLVDAGADPQLKDDRRRVPFEVDADSDFHIGPGEIDHIDEIVARRDAAVRKVKEILGMK